MPPHNAGFSQHYTVDMAGRGEHPAVAAAMYALKKVD